MNKFEISGTVKRFPGKYGWYFVEIEEGLSKDLRPLLSRLWPSLLRAKFRINNTSWLSSIMPIKEGPLFIALPAKIRKVEKIDEGSNVKITVELKI
jgi:hypothetical protein